MSNRPLIRCHTLRKQTGAIQLLFCLLITMVHSAPSNAQIALSLNDIKQQTSDTYLTTGTDAFAIFRLDATATVRADNSSANHISLGLSLLKPSDRSTIDLEVFFQPNEVDEKLSFDPLFRLKLVVPRAALEADSGNLLIALPDEVTLKPEQKIRIDFDRCQPCSFQITGPPKLVQRVDESLPSVNQVFAFRVFNGARRIPVRGISLDTQDWHLNHITRESDALKVDGKDPYAVSHNLDIDTRDLGGVLFALRYQNPSNTARDYQLFYATENHAFMENASSAVRVEDDSDGVSRFVIPLPFLAESQPAARLLQRLRLDLLPADKDTTTWTFNEIKLLNTAQMSEHESWVPARLIHNKLQRASGIDLLKNIVKKVFSDPWFVSLYLFLMIVTGFGFWRQFRR